MVKTTIQVDKELIKTLNTQKVHPRESNNDVLKRLLKCKK